MYRGRLRKVNDRLWCEIVARHSKVVTHTLNLTHTHTHPHWSAVIVLLSSAPLATERSRRCLWVLLDKSPLQKKSTDFQSNIVLTSGVVQPTAM